MSQFLIRDITIDLSTASIGQAIREIERIQRRIQPAMTSLINQLAKKGVEIAKAELIFFPDPAYYTGELSDSVQMKPFDGEAAYVYTDLYYAIFVEYGTGIFNPDSARGFEGWVYFNNRDGHFHWTNGMAPRPFMGLTLYDLETEAKASGGRIIAEYIA